MRPQCSASPRESNTSIDFLKAVTRPAGAAIEFRAIGDGRVTGRAFCRTPRQIHQFVSAHSSDNVYFAVAARRPDARNGNIAGCQHLASLFADIDYKTTTELIANGAVAGFDLEASCIVESGGGLHAYWFLGEMLELPQQADLGKALLRRLAITLGADLSAAEPVRILRVPGTMNYKYAPGRPVELISLNAESIYSIADFERVLANVIDLGSSSVEARDISAHRPAYSAPPDFIRLAAGLTDGERDVGLFKYACSLRARGYSREYVTAAVLDAASRCRPPFPERLAEQKVNSAWKYL